MLFLENKFGEVTVILLCVGLHHNIADYFTVRSAIFYSLHILCKIIKYIPALTVDCSMIVYNATVKSKMKELLNGK